MKITTYFTCSIIVRGFDSFVATCIGSSIKSQGRLFLAISMASGAWDCFNILKGGILHLTHTPLTKKKRTPKQNTKTKKV